MILGGGAHDRIPEKPPFRNIARFSALVLQVLVFRECGCGK